MASNKSGKGGNGNTKRDAAEQERLQHEYENPMVSRGDVFRVRGVDVGAHSKKTPDPALDRYLLVRSANSGIVKTGAGDGARYERVHDFGGVTAVDIACGVSKDARGRVYSIPVDKYRLSEPTRYEVVGRELCVGEDTFAEFVGDINKIDRAIGVDNEHFAEVAKALAQPNAAARFGAPDADQAKRIEAIEKAIAYGPDRESFGAEMRKAGVSERDVADTLRAREELTRDEGGMEM